MLPKQHSQLSRSHYNAIYNFQLRYTIILRMQGLPWDNRNRNFTAVSGDRCARSCVSKGCRGTIAGHEQAQFYYSFERSTRTILRKGCRRTTAGHDQSQFYCSFRGSMRTILRKGCAAHDQSQFYYSFGRSMRTILRKGCISASICRTRASP